MRLSCHEGFFLGGLVRSLASREVQDRRARAMVKVPAMAKGPPGKPELVLAALLEQLDAGDIDVDTYINRKVEAATAHLRGLSEAELQQVKALLRAQVVEEPELRELVRRATGREGPSKT
jgi:hypothetical protein